MIDFISDTVTKPTPAMRAAMAEAEVGDSMMGEDPTVNALQEAVCELLQKDAAIFLPSATMANEIAFLTHTNRGDEIIMEQDSHPIRNESGAPGFLSGAMIRPIKGERGVFDEEDMLAVINEDTHNHPRTRLVSIENTHNLGGGRVWPVGRMMAVSDATHGKGLKVHLDGARLMNAVVASDVPAREFASAADSVTICFSKGLGAPVGAALAGSKEFIKEARYFQRVLGGVMRQAGIIAAGALFALRNNIDRLADDHENARRLADGLADMDGIDINPAHVETNIVFFDVRREGMTADEFVALLKDKGVRMGAFGGTRVRAITHLDIAEDDIDTALAAVRDVVQQ
jgi:threonine aldolase